MAEVNISFNLVIVGLIKDPFEVAAYINAATVDQKRPHSNTIKTLHRKYK